MTAEDARDAAVSGPGIVVPVKVREFWSDVVSLDAEAGEQAFVVLALGLDAPVVGVDRRHCESVAQRTLEVVVLKIGQAQIRNGFVVEDVRIAKHAFLGGVAGRTCAGVLAEGIAGFIVRIPERVAGKQRVGFAGVGVDADVVLTLVSLDRRGGVKVGGEGRLDDAGLVGSFEIEDGERGLVEAVRRDLVAGEGLPGCGVVDGLWIGGEVSAEFRRGGHGGGGGTFREERFVLPGKEEEELVSDGGPA